MQHEHYVKDSREERVHHGVDGSKILRYVQRDVPVEALNPSEKEFVRLHGGRITLGCMTYPEIKSLLKIA